jgi:hypothetical protein
MNPKKEFKEGIQGGKTFKEGIQRRNSKKEFKEGL